MSSGEARCANCVFWHSPDMLDGECRRNTPRLRFARCPESDHDSSAWPPTAATDWCGEHQPSWPALALDVWKK